jgi:hypothetical protein
MDLVYGWTGLTTHGKKIGLDPMTFGVWAVTFRPELIGDLDDPEWTLPHLAFVMTEKDALALGKPNLAGAALVTINPPEVETFTQSAKLAAEKYPEHKEIFTKLYEAFSAEKFE